MNLLNYGSREACQRLVDAGIWIKSERCWYREVGHIHEKEGRFEDIPAGAEPIPRPSMAEAWRELPDEANLCKANGYSFCFTDLGHHFRNVNPTDALIDIKLWLVKEGKI